VSVAHTLPYRRALRRGALVLGFTVAFLSHAYAQQPGPFLNILPPGENGLVNSAYAVRYEATAWCRA